MRATSTISPTTGSFGYAQLVLEAEIFNEQFWRPTLQKPGNSAYERRRAAVGTPCTAAQSCTARIAARAPS